LWCDIDFYVAGVFERELKKSHWTNRETILILAFSIAPLFWLLMYSVTGQVSDLTWPVNFPREYLFNVVIFPILEEIVFRKVLQGKLYELPMGQRSWHGISNANMLTSITFVCFHLFSHSIAWALATFIPSLIFGFFRDRYKQIKPSIALHIFYNAGYFWLFGGPQSH
jgi:membrane protease YdiL (CAAX protease family)